VLIVAYYLIDFSWADLFKESGLERTKVSPRIQSGRES